MAKILIVYSDNKKLKNIVQGLAEGLKQYDHEIDKLNTSNQKRSINFRQYELVLIGSPTCGIFRGKIADDISGLFKKCKNTIGQKVVAFVTPRLFATSKSLRTLMNEIEKEMGCFVKDFKALKNKEQAIEFSENLNNFT